MDVLDTTQVEARGWVVAGNTSSEGIFLADVDRTQRLATAVYNPARLAPADLVEVISTAGRHGCHDCVAEFMAQVPAELALFGWQ